jgi:putative molybdopterin biosynthesis protein
MEDAIEQKYLYRQHAPGESAAIVYGQTAILRLVSTYRGILPGERVTVSGHGGAGHCQTFFAPLCGFGHGWSGGKVCHDSRCTEASPVNIMAGDYLEVDTGDLVPKEYDAVIMIEEVNFFDDHIQIIKAAVPWQHIRSIGEDMVEGDMVLSSLRAIGPYELAALITAGVETVPVIKKPVLAVIPTGTELVDTAGITMAPGDIVESNSYMLMGLAREWGAECLRHDIVIDDREQIRQAVLEVEPLADIIVICSGSSAGREDYTAGIVRELGEILVHGVAVRPGKPAILGIIEQKPVIGVPGYPISAGLIFNLFARPILYRKAGRHLPGDKTMTATISKKLPSPMGVDEYINVNAAVINDRYIAYPLNRGAGLSSILVKSDGTVHVERGQEGLQAGAGCKISLHRSRREMQNSLITLGSHDMSIDFLIDILYRDHGIRLVSTNVGSMGGIMALRRKETHFAGLHLLDEEGGYNISYYTNTFQTKISAGQLVKRHQGLVVAPAIPLALRVSAI